VSAADIGHSTPLIERIRPLKRIGKRWTRRTDVTTAALQLMQTSRRTVCKQFADVGRPRRQHCRPSVLCRSFARECRRADTST